MGVKRVARGATVIGHWDDRSQIRSAVAKYPHCSGELLAERIFNNGAGPTEISVALSNHFAVSRAEQAWRALEFCRSR